MFLRKVTNIPVRIGDANVNFIDDMKPDFDTFRGNFENL